MEKADGINKLLNYMNFYTKIIIDILEESHIWYSNMESHL